MCKYIKVRIFWIENKHPGMKFLNDFYYCKQISRLIAAPSVFRNFLKQKFNNGLWLVLTRKQLYLRAWDAFILTKYYSHQFTTHHLPSQVFHTSVVSIHFPLNNLVLDKSSTSNCLRENGQIQLPQCCMLKLIFGK